MRTVLVVKMHTLVTLLCIMGSYDNTKLHNGSCVQVKTLFCCFLGTIDVQGLIESYMGRCVRQVCPTRGPAGAGADPRWPEGWKNLSYNPAHVRFFFFPLISKMFLLKGKTSKLRETMQCFDDNIDDVG